MDHPLSFVSPKAIEAIYLKFPRILPTENTPDWRHICMSQNIEDHEARLGVISVSFPLE